MGLLANKRCAAIRYVRRGSELPEAIGADTDTKTSDTTFVSLVVLRVVLSAAVLSGVAYRRERAFFTAR
jgi:hypothetical protein